MLTGLVQVMIAGAALVLWSGLRHRRFRVIATVAGSFVAAAALTAVIMYLTGQGALGTLSAGLRRHSWLTGAGFPDPAIIAGLAAVAVAAEPWLSRPWRRTTWAALLLIVPHPRSSWGCRRWTWRRGGGRSGRRAGLLSSSGYRTAAARGGRGRGCGGRPAPTHKVTIAAPPPRDRGRSGR